MEVRSLVSKEKRVWITDKIYSIPFTLRDLEESVEYFEHLFWNASDTLNDEPIYLWKTYNGSSCIDTELNFSLKQVLFMLYRDHEISLVELENWLEVINGVVG